MDTATIRKANASDALAIWNVRTLAIREISHPEYPKDLLETWAPEIMPGSFPDNIKRCDWFVAEIKGEVVATGSLDLEKKSVEGMFTLPGFQGRGLAGLILAQVENAAILNGLMKITLESTLSAKNFYEKNGYKSTERSEYCSPAGLMLGCFKMEKLLNSANVD